MMDALACVDLVRHGMVRFRVPGGPVVYLAGPERYDADAADVYAHRKALCAEKGFHAIVPTDAVPGLPLPPA